MNGRYGDIENEPEGIKVNVGSEKNKPMRAGQVVLNMEVLQWLQEQMNTLAGLDDAEPVWDDEVADRAPTRIIDELEKLGWIRYQDSYGDHAYVSIKYACSTPPRDTDELRLNVVLKKGVINLDLRPWGWYDESDRSHGRSGWRRG